MSTKFDWSQFEEISESGAKPSEEFNWDQFEEIKEPVSRGRSIASAPAKGLIKGLSDVVSMTPFGSTGPLPRQVEERVIEETLPTQNKLTEQILERGARLAPFVAAGPESVGLKLAQALGGAITGQAAKSAGLGETGQGIAEAVGTGLPGLLKTAGRKTLSFLKGTPEPVEQMASGLTKPRAVDSKHAKRALITPEKQQKTIAALDEEATGLAKQTLEKRVPLLKQIEEGADLEGKFQKGFGELQKAAEKHNPTIDTTPIYDLVSKTYGKYRGIPKPHGDAVKILNEMSALRKRPQFDLKNLLKIYRSNNQKRRHIFETSRITGSQKEYVDFLGDFNRAIEKSFETTLPEDSAWMNQFKNLNAQYGKFKQASKSRDLLRSVFGESPNPDSIRKFADDVKKQQKLSMSLGKEGAEEISQIAKDLKRATQAIKQIPARELSVWDKAFPLAVFIPGYHGLGGIAAIPKYLSWMRRAYGSILTSPKSRKAYNEVLRAIISKNPAAYEKAAHELEESLRED